MDFMDHRVRPIAGQEVTLRRDEDHTTSPSWSASYADARKAKDMSAVRPVDPTAGYTCGNNDSTTFFANMQASQKELERIRQQCRVAASVSPTANVPEETVRLDYFARSVDLARQVGQHARSAQEQQYSQLGSPKEVPGHLGHLFIPEPTVALSATPRTPVSTTARDMAMPPGVLNEDCEALPFDDADDVPPSPGQAPSHTDCAIGDVGPVALPGQMEERQADEEDGRSSASLGASESKPASKAESKQGSDNFSDSDEDDSEDNGWPPKPPLLRFKMRLQFSSRFKPTNKGLFEAFNRDLDQKLVETKSTPLQDITIVWLNMVFQMAVHTEFDFDVGFPIIILTMLDAIYPKRVKWREMDWHLQYKRALHKNHAVLEATWVELNMEKAREFRVENTALRVEQMPICPIRDKLEFLRLMKRWYDQRVAHADRYDPLAKRRAIVNECRAWGHTVKFPPWIKFDKEEPPKKDHELQKDTWRVCSRSPINILSAQTADAPVSGVKKFGESFRGHQDGDWVQLVDEPGFMVRVKLDTREQLLLKLVSWKVVSKASVPVRISRSNDADKCAMKKFGDVIKGYQEGDWIELVDERGYVDIYAAGSRTRVLESLAIEPYHKMPEYKRLIWFLGSPNHLTL